MSLEEFSIRSRNLHLAWLCACACTTGVESLEPVPGMVEPPPVTEPPAAEPVSCAELSGDLELRSQSEVDALLPPKESASCVVLRGSLRLEGDDITSLAALERLIAIEKRPDRQPLDGSLLLHQCGSLASLAGLDRLERIAGQLGISESNALAELSALSGLAEVGEGVVIRFNRKLASLDGLANITHIGGSGIAGLWIEENPELSNIMLPQLIALGGSLRINGNDGLLSVELVRLREIAQTLDIGESPIVSRGNSALVFVSLPELVTTGALRIASNPNLLVLDLRALEKTGEIYLADNRELPSLGGLGKLTESGPVRISFNAHLSSLQGLERLENADYLIIRGNHSLASLKGLEGLRQVRALRVEENFSLASVDSLPSISGLVTAPELIIRRNPSLDPIEAAGAVAQIGRRESLKADVYNNGACLEGRHRGDVSFEVPEDFERFGSCRSIDGRVTVRVELAELELLGIEHIGGGLSIGPHFRLTRLALPALVEIAGDLDVNMNFTLSELDVRALRRVGGDITFRDDPVLSRCTVDAIVVGLEGFDGTFIGETLLEDPVCAPG